MIYSYVCKECGKYFELSMSVGEYNSTDKVCPFCTSSLVRRTYQAATVIYNGDGFTKQTKEDVKGEE